MLHIIHGIYVNRPIVIVSTAVNVICQCNSVCVTTILTIVIESTYLIPLFIRSGMADFIIFILENIDLFLKCGSMFCLPICVLLLELKPIIPSEDVHVCMVNGFAYHCKQHHGT